ncbi:hypothetical protein HMPREF9120_02206 [Neisseria sp. oral taxon 020 str. F0370]|nr:hypothetical protein HMPREF9120_02206 [Neisseria sp. oral taxon 020 str. F0370]
MWQKQAAAAAEHEAAAIVGPQAGKGAHQGGFADAAGAVEQQPLARGGLEIEAGEQRTAFGGVQV